MTLFTQLCCARTRMPPFCIHPGAVTQRPCDSLRQWHQLSLRLLRIADARAHARQSEEDDELPTLPTAIASELDVLSMCSVFVWLNLLPLMLPFKRIGILLLSIYRFECLMQASVPAGAARVLLVLSTDGKQPASFFLSNVAQHPKHGSNLQSCLER